MRIALALLAMMAVASASAAPDPLAGERWRHRVLLLFAPAEDDPSLLRQREALASAAAGLQKRDVHVVEVIGDAASGSLDAAALRAAFGPAGVSFAAVLVGKDGGAKLSRATPLTAASLFATIDSMPMARDEAARDAARSAKAARTTP